MFQKNETSGLYFSIYSEKLPSGITKAPGAGS